MRRALDLAQKGLGSVSPNPMVGCVIVHGDNIIGEGWHETYGGPHAEVNAFHSVTDEELIKNATVYVSLEPCSFHGKTPACTDLLLRKHPKRYFYGKISVLVVCGMDATNNKRQTTYSFSVKIVRYYCFEVKRFCPIYYHMYCVVFVLYCCFLHSLPV